MAVPLSLSPIMVPNGFENDALGIAARCGYDALGFRLDKIAPSERALLDSASRAADLGLRILDVEVAFLSPESTPGDHERLMASAAMLGADSVLVISWHDDDSRTVAEFAELCEFGDQYGVMLALEFMPFSGVRDLRSAVAITERVGHPRARVLPDTLHLARSGSSLTELAAVDPRLIGYAQVCDADGQPTDGTPDGLRAEANGGRRLPGDGHLPVEAYLRALPPGIPLSIEAPSRFLQDLVGTDSVRLALLALQRLLRRLQASAAVERA